MGTKCEDCMNYDEVSGCTLVTACPPPRFEDGYCTAYEGEMDGEWWTTPARYKESC